MVDHVDRRKRSEMMRAVKSKHTSTEMIVRSAAHRLGLRFRLHRADLPGKPDLVFPKWKTVIFVNGCFWHRHRGCKKATMPKSNVAFWRRKFERNVMRDKIKIKELHLLGWRVATIWQCQVASIPEATEVLKRTFEIRSRKT
ncbi:DNA mismatch endonuclease Vsr [Parvibaculum sp.]|uniref:very short patch repair endonuclease n=1 Tax=Parvibaculum sp. TaxID=2024848 RepID=UPI002C132460|nr:DNA mismatch endonuclease Vsr [Parvibaculum sp.]HUD51882.1 DNA mismatch endonuclease Vsr [Parvibaculum sp.]